MFFSFVEDEDGEEEEAASVDDTIFTSTQIEWKEQKFVGIK